MNPVVFRARIARAALLLLCIVSACNSDEAIGGDAGSIALSESSVRVGIGASTQLRAFVQLAGGGSEQRTQGITWTTSDDAIASVDQSGTVHGEALGGPVTITATLNGRTAQANVRVVPAHVEITPQISSLAVGATVQFSAIPLDADGTPITAPAAEWSIEFPSGNGVASITPGGQLTILAPGIVTVTASVSGQDGHRDIGVRSAFDGTWTGEAVNGSAIDFVVQFGVVSSFRLPTTVRQACSRQLLSLQMASIAADNRFALGVGNLTDLVTGTFSSPTTMTGAYGEIPAIGGCVDTQGPVPASSFSATRQ